MTAGIRCGGHGEAFLGVHKGVQTKRLPVGSLSLLTHDALLGKAPRLNPVLQLFLGKNPIIRHPGLRVASAYADKNRPVAFLQRNSGAFVFTKTKSGGCPLNGGILGAAWRRKVRIGHNGSLVVVGTCSPPTTRSVLYTHERECITHKMALQCGDGTHHGKV